MKVLFELEQRVEVVRTAYESAHLAVGSLGTVKWLYIYMDREEELQTMCEVRMDDDAEEGTWPFFGCELKAVE